MIDEWNLKERDHDLNCICPRNSVSTISSTSKYLANLHDASAPGHFLQVKNPIGMRLLSYSNPSFIS